MVGTGFGILLLVTLITLFINFKSNRCPNCNKWYFKGFYRSDEDIEEDLVKVFCPRCNHKWLIKYTKSEFQPKN